jgi:predicted AAA+ superfamily ATPase
MTDFASAVKPLIDRLDSLFDRLDAILPPPLPPVDWSATAFRWRTRAGRGWLEAVKQPHRIRFEDLQGVDDQKQRIAQNTKQFVAKRSANNVLLTGARGTGKSSLVKAVLNRFAAKGLRLIEVDKDELVHLPEIVDLIAARRERFIIFCDDLSFESGEPGYKAMKSILDGSITGMPDNLLVYATSNRRHLMPEKMSEKPRSQARRRRRHPPPARPPRRRCRCPSVSASGCPSIPSARIITSKSAPTGWPSSA